MTVPSVLRTRPGSPAESTRSARLLEAGLQWALWEFLPIRTPVPERRTEPGPPCDRTRTPVADERVESFASGKGQRSDHTGSRGLATIRWSGVTGVAICQHVSWKDRHSRRDGNDALLHRWISSAAGRVAGTQV